MVILLTIIHVIICLFLIIVVLLQSGKAADLAGAFGGMGSQTAFGPRGAATVLSKATTIAAGLFMLTSLTLAVMATRGTGASGTTVLEQVAPAKPAQTTQQPPAPAPAPAPVAPGAPVETPGTIKVAPGEAKPGQPQVTLTDPSTGASKTIPLEITPGKPQEQPKKK
jgi:preprotein translocase subunit SecG